MTYGGLWRRSGALILDATLFLPLLIGFYFLDSHSKTVSLSALLIVDIAVLSYHVYFVGRWGKTIGKAAAGLKILSNAGGKVSWTQAFLRQSVVILTTLITFCGYLIAYHRVSAAAYFALGWRGRIHMLQHAWPHVLHSFRWVQHGWLLADCIVFLSNRKRRALHDFIAGTVVVMDRSST